MTSETLTVKENILTENINAEPKTFRVNDVDIQIYDKNSIDRIIASDENGKGSLIPLVRKGIHHYIDNIEGDFFIIRVGQILFPVIAPNKNVQNSYVCSPYGHYISQGEVSIDLIASPVLAKVIKEIIRGLGKILHLGGIEDVVYVNNDLFSTDIYPKNFTSAHIAAITHFLKERYPHSAIIFRSLNTMLNLPLLKSFEELNYKLIASRQVYITDTQNEEIFQTRIIKSDLKLWKECPYEILDESKLTPDDADIIVDLYKRIYITEHSYLNPQINREYIKLMIEKKLLHFIALKENGKMIGVVGFFERDGILMCPLFGYDKEHLQKSVIYRLLSTGLLLEAKARKLHFHQSTGASFYKKIRRAESCQEYKAVFSEHLPFKQRCLWSSLRVIINTFAPWFMEKY